MRVLSFIAIFTFYNACSHDHDSKDEIPEKSSELKSFQLAYANLQRASGYDALEIIRRSPNWECNDAKEYCKYKSQSTSGFSPTGTGNRPSYFTLILNYREVHPLGRIKVTLQKTNAVRSLTPKKCYIKLDPETKKTEKICIDSKGKNERRIEHTLVSGGPMINFVSDLLKKGEKYNLIVEAVSLDSKNLITATHTEELQDEKINLSDFQWKRGDHPVPEDFVTEDEKAIEPSHEDIPFQSCESRIMERFKGSFPNAQDSGPQTYAQRFYFPSKLFGESKLSSGQKFSYLVEINNKSGKEFPLQTTKKMHVSGQGCSEAFLSLPKATSFGGGFTLKIKRSSLKPSCNIEVIEIPFKSSSEPIFIENAASFVSENINDCRLKPLRFSISFNVDQMRSSEGGKIPDDHHLLMVLKSGDHVLLRHEGTSSEINSPIQLQTVELDESQSYILEASVVKNERICGKRKIYSGSKTIGHSAVRYGPGAHEPPPGGALPKKVEIRPISETQEIVLSPKEEVHYCTQELQVDPTFLE